MSLLFWYRLDSDLNDYSGNGRDLLNSPDPVLINTVSGWTAAEFGGRSDDKYLRLDSTLAPPELKGNSSSFTLSFQVYSSSSFPGWFFSIGTSGLSKIVLAIDENRNVTFQTQNLKTMSQDVLPAFSWNHVVLVYKKDDPTGLYGSSTVRIYINGVLRGTYNKQLTLADTDMHLGDDITGNSQHFGGRMTDVRAYDFPFTQDNVTNLYNGGVLYENFTSLTATMYTHLADLSWIALPAASWYRIGRTTDGGSEDTLVSSTTEVSYTMYDISPSVSYVFNIYTDTDLVNPAASTVGVAPAVDSTSTSDLITRLSNDLSTLPSSSVSEIGPFINTALSTGDKLKVSSTDEYVFVEAAGTITHEGDDILTPFDPASGISQSVTITLDGVDTGVSYDEVNNNVQAGGETIGIDEYFILGSYKVTVKEI